MEATSLNERLPAMQAALRCLNVLLQTRPPLPGVPHRAELSALLRRLDGTDLRSPAVRGPHHLLELIAWLLRR